MTTTAAVHEAHCTQDIHQALVDKNLQPDEHFVDSAYVDAQLLVAAQNQGITIVEPARPDVSWQARTDEAFDLTRFEVDWQQQKVTCPQVSNPCRGCRFSIMMAILALKSPSLPLTVRLVQFAPSVLALNRTLHAVCICYRSRNMKRSEPHEPYTQLQKDSSATSVVLELKEHSRRESGHLNCGKLGIEAWLKRICKTWQSQQR